MTLLLTDWSIDWFNLIINLCLLFVYIIQETTSTLKWQTRCLTCFPAGNGYAVGSIEGRVGIQYFDEKENQ